MPRMARRWAKTRLPSTADHLPSTPWATLATTRWVWRWGSRARLVRCTNSPATTPVVASRVTWPPRGTTDPSRHPLEVVGGLGHRGCGDRPRPHRRSPSGPAGAAGSPTSVRRRRGRSRTRCGRPRAPGGPGPTRGHDRRAPPRSHERSTVPLTPRPTVPAPDQAPGASPATTGPLGPARDQVVDVVAVTAGADHVDLEHVRRCARALAEDLAGEP